MNKKKVLIITIVGLIALATLLLFFLLPIKKQENNRKFKIKKTELAPLKERVKIDIHRYEMDLFSLDMNQLPEGVQRLSSIYPENLIEKGVWEDSLMMRGLKFYLQDPVIKEIYEKTVRTYPSLDTLTFTLEDAFARYLYYYPEANIPTFYTVVPGIDYSLPSVYAYNDDIFILLDMYLGANYKMYDQAGIPKYISERAESKYIATDCFKKALVYRHLPKKTKLTLLDNMIEEGKKLYFTELMLPKVPARDIIAYNETKYEWAVQHQKEVWNYMIGKNQLFSKDEKEVLTYIHEAPFTPAFTNQSPGRIGAFIGWKIVQGFMENNPDISLDEMMQMTNSQDILNKSKYKP